MKKMSAVMMALGILFALCNPGSLGAQQQNPLPPVVMQQPQIPPAPLGQEPPPPPVQPGISVVQSIPVQSLLGNLPKAIETAKKMNSMLVPGKVWMMRAPAGEIEIKSGVLYQGVVVGVLNFNSLDGSLLPAGLHSHEYRMGVQIQIIKAALPSVVKSLVILPDAEFVEPESCWLFPVARNGMIVAHIKVYYDGIHVLQDYPANQEMSFYGQ